MTLFLATLLTGIFLIAFGGHFLWHGIRSAQSVQAFPRSKVGAYLLLGIAAAWFLYKVLHLGPADFGQYRQWLFLGFAAVAIASFYYVPDFLAVRGLAALILLTAGVLLDAGYMQYGAPALIFKVFVYFAIVVALILGASPYKLRDFLAWLYRADARPRVFGGIFAAYGVLLLALSFTY